MTFEEARDLLNHMNTDEVSKEMEDWHPALLGQMLMAVNKAKLSRYPSYHPDYDGVVAQLAAE